MGQQICDEDATLHLRKTYDENLPYNFSILDLTKFLGIFRPGHGFKSLFGFGFGPNSDSYLSARLQLDWPVVLI